MTSREQRLSRPDGRTIAWVETGDVDGRPILRLPGTPGSRLWFRTDQTPWLERGLRMIVTERPGFGASTRHLEGTIVDHADDLAAILDDLEIQSLPVVGVSGASLFVLALAARHPERVQAAAIVVGAAPMDEGEADKLIGLNADAHRLAQAGDRDGLMRLLAPVRKAIIADPLASFRNVMNTAPPSDQAIMNDSGWQEMLTRGLSEALRPGVDGWVDESMLLVEGWGEVDVSAVQAGVTWWHGDEDRNTPLSAARRLVGRLADAHLILWPAAGHLTPYQEEAAILDQLLARAGATTG